MGPSFRTVGTELEGAAVAAVEYFRSNGYRVSIEPIEFEYPSTPTIRCTRLKETLLLEAVVATNLDAIDGWVAFAKSRSKSTSFALLVVSPPGVTHEELVQLKQRNVGLFSFNGALVTEVIGPRDLTVSLQLPPLEMLKPATLRKIKPCFEKIERGEWVDGFRDACQVLESMAVAHLVDGIQRGRLLFRSKNGSQKTYGLQQIKRMPQGALVKVFAEIVAPTQVDSIYHKALSSTNPDRIKAVHKTSRAKNSARFRATIGQHLWTIVSALKQI